MYFKFGERVIHCGCISDLWLVGQAWQNGYAERLMRTIKEEVDLSHYLSYADTYSRLGHFLDEVYMHKRIHSALGYLTPVEFESQWLSLQPSSDTVIQQ